MDYAQNVAARIWEATPRKDIALNLSEFQAALRQATRGGYALGYAAGGGS